MKFTPWIAAGLILAGCADSGQTTTSTNQGAAYRNSTAGVGTTGTGGAGYGGSGMQTGGGR